MEKPLHLVTEEELPVLQNWLEQFLPESQKIYGTIREQLKGRWRGTRYLTLGWPDILAVGEGNVDASTCKCSGFFNEIRAPSVYSPDPIHLEALLKRREFLDWSKPIIFIAIPYSNGNVVDKVSKDSGSKFSTRYTTYMMGVTAADLKVTPVPEGYELRRLDPDLHADYVTSTWPHKRKHADSYVYELLRNFPSVGLFDSSDQCIGVEMTTEFGFAALLHVREEARGRGLGKVVASHLARELLKEQDIVYATILLENQPSIVMHQKIGFKIISKVDWYLHSMDGWKILDSQKV